MIVVWRITQSCNLQCPFCAYDRRVINLPREAGAGEIRRFGNVLAEYQKRTGNPVLVSWIGGEPFLFPQLNEMTVYFSECLGLRISATTNGTKLVDDRIREHVLAHYSEITVSVDGISHVHDGLRGWRGGYDRLGLSVRVISETKRRTGKGPLLRANVILMHQTFDAFEALCQELVGWGIEEITFNQLGGRDRPEFYPEHRLLPEQARLLKTKIPDLRVRLAKVGVKLRGSSDYLERIQASSLNQKMEVKDCSPGERFMFIDENGIASPCSFTGGDLGIPISQMTRASDIDELPRHFARNRLGRCPSACKDCHSTQVFDKFLQ